MANVLVVVTNYGVEQDELVKPVEHLRDGGAQVTVAAKKGGEPVRTLVGDQDPGQEVRPDAALADVDPADFDLLVVPGGTINADSLRQDEDAVRIATAFANAGKPVAAICHGPWLLVEAGVVAGKKLTSYPSLKTDIGNAGAAEWVDSSAAVDDTGYTLITSRNPDDIPDFLAAIDKALG